MKMTESQTIGAVYIGVCIFIVVKAVVDHVMFLWEMKKRSDMLDEWARNDLRALACGDYEYMLDHRSPKEGE